MSAKSFADWLRYRFWCFRDALRDRFLGRRHRRNVFQRIYEGNLWDDPESVSGTGSGSVATAAIRGELRRLFEKLGVKSILDAPCGDFFWMKEIASDLERYWGVDIVPALVEKNQRDHGTAKITFQYADIATDPLPAADLVMCRDCFIHLPTRMILDALENFRASGARYLLLTCDLDAGPYRDIPIGSFRPVNFLNAPFLFPEPRESIQEVQGESRRLCLWEFTTVPVFSAGARR